MDQDSWEPRRGKWVFGTKKSLFFVQIVQFFSQVDLGARDIARSLAALLPCYQWLYNQEDMG